MKIKSEIILSIITTTYNVEMYIAEFLNSVLHYKGDEIELIIVNDGSTDETLDRIQKFKDKRIKIINQENKGLSAARNIGFKCANGEYIWFIDSDDYISEDAINIILEIIKYRKVDLCWFNGFYFEDGSEENKWKIFNYDKLCAEYSDSDKFIKDILYLDKKHNWYVWHYVFKKELMTKENILFYENKKFEDIDFTYKIILAADKIFVENKGLYYYRLNRKGAITNGVNQNKERDLLFMADKCIHDLDNVKISYEAKKLLKNNFSYNYFNVLTDYAFSPKNEKKIIKQFLYEYKDMLEFTEYGKYCFLKKIIKVFGIDITSYILKVNRMIKK